MIGEPGSAIVQVDSPLNISFTGEASDIYSHEGKTTYGVFYGAGTYREGSRVYWWVEPTKVPFEGILGYLGFVWEVERPTGQIIMDSDKQVIVDWKPSVNPMNPLIILLMLGCVATTSYLIWQVRPTGLIFYPKLSLPCADILQDIEETDQELKNTENMLGAWRWKLSADNPSSLGKRLKKAEAELKKLKGIRDKIKKEYDRRERLAKQVLDNLKRSNDEDYDVYKKAFEEAKNGKLGPIEAAEYYEKLKVKFRLRRLEELSGWKNKLKEAEEAVDRKKAEADQIGRQIKEAEQNIRKLTEKLTKLETRAEELENRYMNCLEEKSCLDRNEIIKLQKHVRKEINELNRELRKLERSKRDR